MTMPASEQAEWLADALDLVAAFGRAATWTTYASSYSASTGINTRTPTAVSVVCTPPLDRKTGFRGGDVGTDGHGVVYIAASGLTFTPAVSNLVTFGTEKWTVVEVETIAAGETAVLHVAQVRRGAPA